MEELEKIISRNICKYRKMAKMTQGELAERLSFSDKSISKWERGDAVPDVVVLYKMCEIFGITLNDIISAEEPKKPRNEKLIKRNQDLITIMSVGAVWLVATIVFALLMVVSSGVDRLWLSFVYAVPASAIVFLVFSCIWGRWWYKFIHMSTLMWTIIISLCITFNSFWEFLFVGIPMQALAILWTMLEWNIRRKNQTMKSFIISIKEKRKNKRKIKDAEERTDEEDILLKK